MSFWTDEDGTDLVATKEYSAPTIEPIPSGTGCILRVEDAGWKEGFQTTAKFVNLKVRVLKPAAYKDRVFFNKFWINDLDPGAKNKSGDFDEKKAKAKRTDHRTKLMTIDANHKSKMAKSTSAPTDESLALDLIGAEFWGAVDVWDIGGKKGNWIRDVKAKTTPVEEAAAPKKAEKPAPAFLEDDDDIPY